MMGCFQDIFLTDVLTIPVNGNSAMMQNLLQFI